MQFTILDGDYRIIYNPNSILELRHETLKYKEY